MSTTPRRKSSKKPEPAATWVATSELTPWEDNPRKNDGRPVEAVMDSIKRFGFAAPIIARQEDGQVIAGHTRLKAAKALGLERVPVRYLDLDPADAKLLALADNKVGELAEWDDEALARIVADIDGAELALAGFTEEDLAALIDSEPEPDFGAALEPEGAHDDELPEEVEPITKPGDVVDLGPHVLHCGDCIEVMQGMAENSVDAIVTDPPYGLGFMGKAWDALPPGLDWARECLRVLKPGGHIVAFGGQRTIHRLTCSLEDAGFAIRELFGWLQWQGFPKSLSASIAIDKAAGKLDHHGAGMLDRSTGLMTLRPHTKPSEYEAPKPATEDARIWSGFGTALKPCLEPAVIARKPLVGTVAENLLEWGTGALNIDGCRYAYGDEAWPGPQENDDTRRDSRGGDNGLVGSSTFKIRERKADEMPLRGGRWPANVYACPKASRGEREAGCDGLPGGNAAVEHHGAGTKALNSPRAGAGRTAGAVGNHHPTVKPVKLMRWLVRLVGCQPGSTILDPFAGSGTTLLAAHR